MRAIRLFMPPGGGDPPGNVETKKRTGEVRFFNLTSEDTKHRDDTAAGPDCQRAALLKEAA